MDSRVGTAAIIPAGSKRAVNSRTRGHEAKVGLRQSHKRTKRVRRAQTVDANTKCVLIFMDKSDSTGPRRRGDRMKARSSLLTVGADSYPAGLFACSTLSHCGQRALIAPS